ncbi:MAG: hypothetical protein J0M12_02395 [Deltaproteobacteria bacterium]|nr:hypothetical protein [Deltaproteobacteria bacterium]
MNRLEFPLQGSAVDSRSSDSHFLLLRLARSRVEREMGFEVERTQCLMRSNSFIVRGLVVVAAAFGLSTVGGCGSVPFTGGQVSFSDVTNVFKSSSSGIRENSVTAAKMDSSDPVGATMVRTNDEMAWPENYGGTCSLQAAKVYQDRQKLVDKREETKVAERAPLTTEIKAKSDEIVALDKKFLTDLRAETVKAKASSPDEAVELDKQIAWIDARLALLNRVPAQYSGKDFNVAALANGTAPSMASK